MPGSAGVLWPASGWLVVCAVKYLSTAIYSNIIFGNTYFLGNKSWKIKLKSKHEVLMQSVQDSKWSPCPDRLPVSSDLYISYKQDFKLKHVSIFKSLLHVYSLISPFLTFILL